MWVSARVSDHSPENSCAGLADTPESHEAGALLRLAARR
jgi:hypothetical protein